MTWVKILDHDDQSFIAPIVLTFVVSSSTSSTLGAYISICIFFLDIIVPKKISCLVLQNRFNYSIVVTLSSISTSK
jgi:hypothetical protein